MVLIATFASGFKLVYKPRGMAVDVHFQSLLEWLNGRGARPGFRTLTVLDRGSYGWVEFANAASCQTDGEVRRFYERLGGYLAILYALEATDFHYENLIAAGEHPVLLDLEAFFHPRLGELDAPQRDNGASTAIYDSVLSVGLLPQRIHIQATADSIDLSGIGRSDGELTPHRVPHWESAGTDEMRYARRRVELTEGKNRPVLNGAAIDVLDYAESIAAGFTDTYQRLCEHRAGLLAADGPVAAFAADQVRVVLRPTWTYGLLLNESFHPDVLHDALDRDRLFDRLWVDTSDGCYQRVIASELEDLQNADIPMFTARPDSCDLWTSSGRRIAGFFREPGMALVRRRIERLGDDDLQRQLWFLRASLAAMSAGSDQMPPVIRRSSHERPEERIEADTERLLAGAQAVGNRLEGLALRDGDGVSWLGLTLTSANYWCPVALGANLYHGLAGVALFLGYLGGITGQERYTALAEGAMRTARRQVEHALKHVTTIGAFEGWGGSIYALTHLGALWKQPELWAEAERIVGHLPDLIEQDERLDIIGGAAGCIGGLVSLYRCTRSEHALAAAIQCGERLLASSRNMEQGIGWVTSADSTPPLTGFSHGAAGVAWALLEAGALSGQERFRRAAQDAMAYERGLFSAERGNWPDLRPPQTPGQEPRAEQNRFMTAWCHGASGIGLARLHALQHLEDPEIRHEIDIALKTTLVQGFGGTHCLCHGDLGNLELVLQAASALSDHPCRAHIRELCSGVLQSIAKYGWLCAVPLQVETPGLMLGLAGIGYGLLRQAVPTRVPSVLLLEPPRT
jgi:type 2 lantibiotic biosynthesis protein LanM